MREREIMEEGKALWLAKKNGELELEQREQEQVSLVLQLETHILAQFWLSDIGKSNLNLFKLTWDKQILYQGQKSFEGGLKHWVKP